MNNIKLQPKDVCMFTLDSSLQLENDFSFIPEEFEQTKPTIKIVKKQTENNNSLF